MPKANEAITAREVRVVTEEGEMLGVMPIAAAIQAAKARGKDLVEVSPNAKPPVCKILDYGKFKYQQQKKEHENRKKQKVVQIKEIKLRPTIDAHDLEIKLRSIHKFIKNGDKVKITLRFRGREIVHKDIGMDVLNRIRENVVSIAKIEIEPRFEGRQIVMVIAPMPGGSGKP